MRKKITENNVEKYIRFKLNKTGRYIITIVLEIKS